MGLLLVSLALLAGCAGVTAVDNGLGATPQMGWNSWNFFRCNINETLVRAVADAMVTSGLRDAGYKYVNIDDCWMEKRDNVSGRIVPFATKFPSGMKNLADYIHERGLKFGVYSDTGNNTCEGYPGSWGYEKLDAQTYAEWGVDYLKYDYCGMDKANETVEASYERMRDALNATGRPIFFSLCSWGAGQPHLWGKNVGNSWRVGIDVFAAWDADHAKRLKLPSFLQPILTAIANVEPLFEAAQPGGFNDPDMLVVGLDGMYPYGIVQDCPEHVKGCKPGDYISRDRWGKVGGLTQTEQRSHFAFWCMLASPLILGNDPRHMSRATLEILLAKELIAINQDPLGKQARKVWEDGTLQIWAKQLVGDGRWAVLLFNMGGRARDIPLKFKLHLQEAHAKWSREGVEDVHPDCRDSLDGCRDWAKGGECEKNPGFMFDKCRRSCPEGCPYPQEPPGPQATALVRDAWLQEDWELPVVAKLVAEKVEPHEARVLLLTFTEPKDAESWLFQARRQREDDMSSRLKAALGPGGGGGGGGGVTSRRQRASSSVDGGGGGGSSGMAERRQLQSELDRMGAELKMAKHSGEKLAAELTACREEVARSASTGRGAGAAEVQELISSRHHTVVGRRDGGEEEVFELEEVDDTFEAEDEGGVAPAAVSWKVQLLVVINVAGMLLAWLCMRGRAPRPVRHSKGHLAAHMQ